MNIEERMVGDVVVLSIRGDIKLGSAGGTPVADRVRSVLQQGHQRLVLDLAHVRYVDSAGLGELVEALSAARNRGGTVKLLHVTKRLNDLLALTRLLTVEDLRLHLDECQLDVFLDVNREHLSLVQTTLLEHALQFGAAVAHGRRGPGQPLARRSARRNLYPAAHKGRAKSIAIASGVLAGRMLV